MRRRLPGGIQLRLAIAIPAITLGLLAASFYALHEGTGADLQDRIDQELREQQTEFDQEALPELQRPDQLAPISRRFITSQAYHPESRIFAIEVPGGAQITNESELLESEIESESESEAGEGAGEGGHEAGALLQAPEGLSTVTTAGAGELRVLSEPILLDGEQVGTFRVADPLNSVDEAQAGLRKTFLIVGLLAVAASVALAIWVASLLTRPLREMAETASAIDAGDLTRRVEGSQEGEVAVLADSFNHMLDRLEDAFDRQRAFVSDASHELRNPLTVLRGQIELLQRSDPGPRDRAAAMDTLLREIDRMNRLVDDMLVLARAESGTLLQPRAIGMEDFLTDLERDLPLLGRREYRVSPAPGGTLDADPDRLAQVLRNLVRNAVQHTGPEGEIDVTVAPQNGNLRFSVSDTGPGVDQDKLARLFDRFYRTDPGRGREHGGSGLGLAIARAIVEAHGGRIWASSPPGEGVTVSFELPGYRLG